MNSINHNAINNLKDFQLTELLLKLLFLEHKKYNFENCYISVPQNINVGDGGEDGRIETSDYKGSAWVTDNLCLYQCKASSMPKGKCKEELLDTVGKFKPQVKDILDKKGTYILVTTQSIVEKSLNNNSDRVASIRQGIKEGKIKEGLSKVDAEEFSQQAKIKIYDANLLSNWANQYISAVSYIQICNGYRRPIGLLTWNELKTYEENQARFKSSPELEDIINKLRTDIYKGKHFRIQGPSGIGKSRLICEIMSPGEKDDDGKFDLVRKTISENSIFFDISNNNPDLLNFVKSHALDTQAIIVLDNCPPNIHFEFSKECKRVNSKLQLVSIDFDRVNNSQGNNDEVLDLKSDYYIKITEDILREKYQGELSDRDIDFLIKFSEGNTKMAIDFAKASVGKINLNEAFNNELVKKIIFGREQSNNDEFKILKVISVFKTVEYPKDEYFHIQKNHYNQLLEGIKFFSVFFKIDIELFRTTIKKFIRRGTIERRGNLIMIRPNPLSLKLSLLFWDDLAPSRYEEFITHIPESLKIPLCDQLEQIGSVDKAKELVETIWGVEGNFSTAEILNSNMGSRLFRSIVTVNTEVTTKVLVKNYLDQPKEFLEKVVEGRQNIVWALERLCFRKETFSKASKVLMCFAVAEIETYYSNNSTSYFLQLFKVYLAGTEVPYLERIKTLKWALHKKDKDFDILVIKACESALASSMSNTRILGAENQGSSLPLKDYQPSTLSDIHQYIDEVLKILSPFLNSHYEISDLAQKAIYKNLYTFDDYNYNFDKLHLFLDFTMNSTTEKKEFVKTLRRIKSFRELSINTKETIEAYLEKMSPKTIEEKITNYVSEPEYDYEKDINEDLAKKKAEDFANYLFENKINIIPYLPNLLLGHQFQAFHFGKKYVELNGFDEEFLNKILKYLITIKDEKWDVSFLNGYLSALDENQKQITFNNYLKAKSLFSTFVFRTLKPNLENALKLIELVDKKEDSRFLRFSNYGLAMLPIDDLIIFLKALEEKSFSIPQIASIIYKYIRHSHDKSKEELKLITIYLTYLNSNYNLLETSFTDDRFQLYEWQELTKFLLLVNPKGVSKTISEKIVDFYKSRTPFFRSEHHIKEIAIKTLEKDFDNSWPVYSTLLKVSGNFLLFDSIFDLNFLMGVDNKHKFFRDEKKNDKIFQWCKKNSESAKQFIRISPLLNENGSWFKFTLDLINEFGFDESFISELSSNLHSMTTWGSRVPFLKSRQNLVHQLIGNKHKKLNDWATEEFERYNKEIKIEQIKDEEGNVRW